MDDTNEVQSTRAQRLAWCFFDFANSAFPTVIVTAVYVIYFKGVVVGDAEPGYSDRLWGLANSIAAGVVFLSSPILGSIADQSGRKQSFLIVYVALCSLATAALSLTGPGTVLFALTMFILADVGFEGSLVFYNAFLPELVPREKMERLSGAAWALGYFGGLGCLLVILPWAKAHTNWVPLAVALWFGIFSFPSLYLLRDRRRPVRAPGDPSFASLGLFRLLSTLKKIREHVPLIRFLMAYFFYANAVNTIIVFAVAFSRDTLTFSMSENILLVIVMNVVAAPGAYVFGWLAERVGAKKTIIVTLFMWLVVVVGAEISAWPDLFEVSGAKLCFWGVATLASLCIGAVQATSRTFVGQLAPLERAAEYFGFMAFAGKGSAILGPLVFGITSDLFNSQRVAVLSIGLFFLVGLLLMFRVHAPDVLDKRAVDRSTL